MSKIMVMVMALWSASLKRLRRQAARPTCIQRQPAIRVDRDYDLSDVCVRMQELSAASKIVEDGGFVQLSQVRHVGSPSPSFRISRSLATRASVLKNQPVGYYIMIRDDGFLAADQQRKDCVRF